MNGFGTKTRSEKEMTHNSLFRYVLFCLWKRFTELLISFVSSRTVCDLLFGYFYFLFSVFVTDF